MPIAALYDVHGNLPALEAVLDEVAAEGVDEVVIGGDLVPGPMPAEVIERVRALDLPVRYVRGNGEREVLAARAGGDVPSLPDGVRRVLRWVADALSADQADFLATWPMTVEADVPGVGSVLFCHATPRSDGEIFTRATPDAPLLPIFAGLDADLVVCGHTHMAFDRTVGRTRVVNAGSVGMPWGRPGAHWLLLGPGVEARHTPYDLEAAAARVRETRYPDAEAFADRDVLAPRSEDEALAMLRPAELR